MLDDIDTTDWSEAIVYRIAFGCARRHLERDRYSLNDGHRLDPRALERLRADIRRELGEYAGRALEVIELAIDDATAGRKPRW